MAKLDKAMYTTLYNGSSKELYVRKEMECQRRYQKLITDAVTLAMEGGSSGSGKKRTASSNKGNSDKNEMSKGPWSAEEDRKVVELVGKYGPKKWSQIAL